MAGNRAVYEEALKSAIAHAAEQHFADAAAAYQKALAEFPDEPTTLGGLGSVLEKMGRKPEAFKAYLAAGDHYAHQRLDLAMERWRDAARVDPQNVPAHANLLRAYLSTSKTREAVHEYLTLANIYQAHGQTQQALELCQHALKLSPQNSEVQALIDRLNAASAPAARAEPDPLDLFEDEGDEEGSGESGSPMESTRQRALASLAEAVFGEAPPQTGPLVMRPMSKRQVDTLISKALDCQTMGDTEEAVACYEEVLRGGLVQPAVNFNLGMLYQQQLRFDDALAQFQQAVGDPEYRLGSLFALGECYRALGRIDEARDTFIEVLKIVDLGTVGRDQADDLIQLYEELARTHAAKGEREQATEFVNSLIGFLGEKGWEDKVVKARQRLDSLTREGPILSLADLLTVPGSERILHAIGLAQEYQKRGLGYAAMDELSQAMVLAPTFLPLHWQMGETLVSMGKTDQAVAKFLTIADVYRTDNKFSQAMAMYERALRLAPMNVGVRIKLIELLISHGEIDRALEHYLALGDAYYQMAQLDRAREKYNEALQLAPRGSAERNWEVRLLHRTGDLDMQRVDWRQAVGVYERIRKLAPNDEKARLTLMDLYTRFGQAERAMAELDGLLRLYRQAGKHQKAVAVLQEQVEEHPESIPLRTWIAQAHLDAGNVPEALPHLDVLGDLQLQSGRKEDAVTTIKTILRLHPPNEEAYRQLLEQITGAPPTG